MFQQLLEPAILFFILGFLAVLMRSSLTIPANVSQFLAIYLLMALGLKGGVSLSETHFTPSIIWTLVAATSSGVLIPIVLFFFLKYRFSTANSAAIAATYGSVSAVTFLTAVSKLEGAGIPYGGHMTACLAIMEAPSIIISLFLYQKFSQDRTVKLNLSHLFHESLFNGSVFILLGSLLIGALVGKQGAAGVHLFIYDLFKGFLCFFLLDLGILAGKQIKEIPKKSLLILFIFAIVVPVANAMLGLAIAKGLDLPKGDGFLLMTLMGSASYIAVPAALKTTLPQAQSSYFVAPALAITFPFNIIFGLNLYFLLA